MGCCGCSLYAWTITAGLFTLLDSVLFITFDILLLIFITTKSHLTDDKNFQDFINGFKFDEKTTIITLIGVKIAIRVFWLISSVLLFIGNAREHRTYLNVWQYLTVTRIIFAIGTSIYAVVSLLDDLKDLFKNDKWSTDDTLVAKFTILIDFLELGPIWWLIFIAFIICVYRRGLEIETKSRQVSQVDSWANINQFNRGSVAPVVSAPTHPAGLTQEPNPFAQRSEVELNGKSAVQPILKVNDVIAIPRATLSLNKEANDRISVQEYDNKAYNKVQNRFSSLAQRTTYTEYGRNDNNVPKRNNSYNIAQNAGQRPRSHYSYDNKGYDRNENDFYKPGYPNRASLKK